MNPTGPGSPDADDCDQAPGSSGERMLQCAYGTRDRASRFYRDQMANRLNEQMIEFIGRMEMAFIATSDADGEADCSFRAGPPGFIQVLGDQRIAYPEYRGNGVLASLGNIKENPHIGMLMVDFVRDLIGLHVNGRAAVVDDVVLHRYHPWLPREFERGRTPERWVVVDVVEAYIHCRKHIPRMQPVGRDRAWGTDDGRSKGGDFFGVRAQRRAEAAAAETVELPTPARGGAFVEPARPASPRPALRPVRASRAVQSIVKGS
ncbi:pyridoxamine 5-phosphate oxidase [Amycolatopsis antarctica]|uniref:Pyridoxamine 5-phosphate oxidase n=1 Tax=Amycolatopsis antarctica TaxID=1854586 RepID=A0A263CZ12_9PSEU|nr:pyridoxamine 5'-phosphate oxidase family protein [Amycolatopsis antarctica]OZM71402.1 pyridoxamine 5-phosphate oxidase [Amycolatopsis antarctica]